MNGRFLVYATSRSFGQHTEAGVRLLEKAGCRVLLAGPGGPWPEEAMRQGREAAGRTLGIIGLGRIGREVAVLALGLGLRVVAYDIVHDRAFAAAHGIRYDMLPLVLGEADAVSVHVPLTDQTRGLLGATALAWMRPEAVLINVARGGVVDERALADALAQGRLARAAIDVYEREPPWDSPLLGLDNVLLTPHIVHSTRDAMERVDVMVATDVVAVLSGNRPSYPVPAG